MKAKRSPAIAEINSILIGWVRYENIYCVAANNIKNASFQGLNNGAIRARLFGTSSYTRDFSAPSDCKYTIEQLFKIFREKTKKVKLYRHQLVYLFGEPDSLVFLIRPLVSNPVVVTILPEKNKMNVSVYTARTLFARLHAKRMMKYVGKKLPDNVTIEEIKKSKGKEDKNNEKNNENN